MITDTLKQRYQNDVVFHATVKSITVDRRPLPEVVKTLKEAGIPAEDILDAIEVADHVKVRHSGILMIRDFLGTPQPHPVPDPVYIYVQQLEAALKSTLLLIQGPPCRSPDLVDRIERILGRVG